MKNINTTSNDVVNYQIEYFNQFGSLPTNYIECTVSGTAYTCFGTNLKNKIQKAGGIKELLTTFVGRGAKKDLPKAPKADKKTGRTEATVSVKKTAPKAKKAVNADMPF